jgi:hypothetical protein
VVNLARRSWRAKKANPLPSSNRNAWRLLINACSRSLSTRGFYHTVLKCYVIVDLKTGKLTHQDLGQLQLYVNYYDRERRTEGDNPTLGLILCADKNDAVVKYTLGPEQEKKIFASRYKLYLPTEAELKAEIRREIKLLRT